MVEEEEDLRIMGVAVAVVVGCVGLLGRLEEEAVEERVEERVAGMVFFEDEEIDEGAGLRTGQS